jgi:hypothetical protein
MIQDSRNSPLVERLGYKGKPFADERYSAGPQLIPGRVELALFDLGGAEVAYHNTGGINHGSAMLNQESGHQRPHATPYHWNFRRQELVDTSYTKDFADFTAGNYFTPAQNQLYLGWTEDGDWANYTVNVLKPGRFRVLALYANDANTIKLSIDGKPAGSFVLPLKTGGMHCWNKADIGQVEFACSGIHLLTFHYNSGNNFAYLEFIRVPE